MVLEALACVIQLLPGKRGDFINYYKPDKVRKDITYANYTMSDYLRGLTVTRTHGIQRQSCGTLTLCFMRFNSKFRSLPQRGRAALDSSLFDTRALV